MEGQNKERKDDPIVKLRSVLKSGSSYYISIPPEFIKLNRIKKGDRLPVLANKTQMRVIPMNED